jgi:hypothetical protein
LNEIVVHPLVKINHGYPPDHHRSATLSSHVACARKERAKWEAHLNEAYEGVVDASTMGQEEAGAWRELVEEEELLLRSYQPVISLLRLLDLVLVRCICFSLDNVEGAESCV